MTCSISIALCTFNGARFLDEQLASYVHQERPPDELLVCDDGSIDDTLPILRRFSETAPFPVRIEVNGGRLGVAANFSRAIALCTGDIIALSDQDDVWYPAKLRTLAETFEGNSSLGMVFTDADAIDAAGRPLGYRLWQSVLFTSGEQRWARSGRLRKVLLRHNVATGATLAIRSSFRDVILPIPGDSLHDAWIAILVAAIAPVKVIAQPLIGYRQHATQVSGGERVLSIADQARIARTQNSDTLETTARRFDAIRDRLLRAPSIRVPTSLINDLDQKAIHVRARARMRVPGANRLPLIARELVSGRYFRYSHPWKYVAADLFL